MRPVNIYISKKDRARIKKIQQKYCLSLSTIIDKIILPIWKAIETKEKCEKFRDTYLYKTNFKEKTSIKPRMEQFKIKNKSKVYTNAIKVYLNNDYSMIIQDKKRIDQLRSELDDILSKTVDEYWNYNEMARNQIKFIKENPEYVKRIMEGK